MNTSRGPDGRFASKGDNIGYRRVHSRMNELKQKIGKCVTCNTPGDTEWSYVGDDPRGWENDPTKYIEECRSCNISRSDKVGRYDRTKVAAPGMTGRKHTDEARAKMRGSR